MTTMNTATQEQLPHLYSPFEHPTDGLRYKSAGIATEVGTSPEFCGSIAIVEMKAPGTLILPKYLGDQISQGFVAAAGATKAIDRAIGIVAGRIVNGLATPDEHAMFDRAAEQADDDHENEMLARNGGEFPRGEFAYIG